MKKINLFLLLSLLVTTFVHAQVEYQANGNDGFAGPVGNSTLSFVETGGTITATFTKGTSGNLNDALVMYISTGVPGRSVIDGTVNDQSTELARAVSSAGADASNITFHTGFQATHAIAISANNSALYEIPASGSVNNGDLVLVDNVGSPSAPTDASFTFDFDYTEIGLAQGDEFRFLITYLNSTNGFTSNEAYPGDLLNNSTVFLDAANVADQDFTVLSSYSYPTDNVGPDVLYNDFYQYFNPFNDSVKSDDGSRDDIASWAYAANAADAFGGIATFENPGNESLFVLNNASFIMSNWDDDINNPFSYDFKLELYEVDRSGANPVPGDTIAVIEQPKIVPVKENFTGVAAPNAGYTDSVSSDYLISFDLNGLAVNGDEVLFMVGFEITSQNDGNDANNLDDRLDQMNIAAYKTDNSANPSIVATPTSGTKTGNDMFWRSDSQTNGQISWFSAGTVMSKFTGEIPNQWEGDTDNSFSNADNWESGFVPQPGEDAVIPSGTPVAVIDDPDGASVRNLIVESNANVEVRTYLQVDADISNDGSITFISDENGTGQFDSFDGEITANGDIIVQRFIPVFDNDSRGFRLLASAVDSDNSIFDNWQESGNSPAGFGTQIAGDVNGNNGFDPTPSGNVTMFTYNFSDLQNFTGNPIPNTDVNKLNTGEAYRVLIRGDRNYDITSNPPNPPNANTTLRATGDLAIGDQVFDLNPFGGEVNAIGNPYQANVNLNQLSSSNINTNFYWMFDPNIGVGGAYVTVELPSGDSVGSSEANQFIMPGQGFFVQTLNDGNASLTFDELAKDVQAVPTQVFQATFSMDLLLYEDQALANNDNEYDALRINFIDDANNGIDQFDAIKFPNPNENLARDINGDNFSVEERDSPTDDEVLPLFTNNYTATDYTFVININNLPAPGSDEVITPFLVDNFEGTQTELSNGANQVSFTVDPLDPGSIADDRFALEFDVEFIGTVQSDLSALKVYPNPVDNERVNIVLPQAGTEELSFSLYNMLGQRVLQTTARPKNGKVQLNLQNQQAGTYILSIQQGDKKVNRTLIIH